MTTPTFRVKDPNQPLGYTSFYASDEHPFPVKTAGPDDIDPLPVTGMSSGPVSWNDLTDKPATFAPIIGTTATTAKAGNYAPTWAQVTGKPTTFPPANHTHVISDVTGLAAELSTIETLQGEITTLQGLVADLTTRVNALENP